MMADELHQAAINALQTWARENEITIQDGHVRQGWVGWLGRHRDGGYIDGVHVIEIGDWNQPGQGTRVVLDSRHFDEQRTGWNMGYGRSHPRVGSMRWRIAEGYTNGFPKRDILWFTLTRSLPRLLRLPHRLQDRLLDDFTKPLQGKTSWERNVDARDQEGR